MNIPDIWTKDNAVSARDFFNSPTGQKMIEILMLNRPVIKNDASDSVVARAGIARQTWEDCVNGIAQFTIEPEQGSGESHHLQIDTSRMTSRKMPEAEIQGTR